MRRPFALLTSVLLSAALLPAQPDPALAVCVSSRPQPTRGEAFLVNSVASGGTNYSLVVRAAPGRS